MSLCFRREHTMNFSSLTALSLFAVAVLATSTVFAAPSAKEVNAEISRLAAAKDNDAAVAYYESVRDDLAASPGAKAEIVDNLMRCVTDDRKKVDFVIDCVEAITNISHSSAQARRIYAPAFSAAVAVNDFKSFEKLVGFLLRDKNTAGNYNLWEYAANALVNDGVPQKGRKDDAPFVAGFREGGSTFGFWATEMVIDGRTSRAATRLSQAEKLLTEAMPCDNLDAVTLLKRDITLLNYRARLGSEKSAFEMHDSLFASAKKLAASGKPEDLAVARDTISALFDFHNGRREWAAAADLTREVEKSFSKVYGDSIVNMIGKRTAYGLLAGDDALYDGGVRKLASLPLDQTTVDAYFAAAEVLGIDRWTGNAEIPILFEPLADKFGKLTRQQQYAVATTLVSRHNSNNNLPAVKRWFAEAERIYNETAAHNAAENEKAAAAKAKGEDYKSDFWPEIKGFDGLKNSLLNSAIGELDYATALDVLEERVAKGAAPVAQNQYSLGKQYIIASEGEGVSDAARAAYLTKAAGMLRSVATNETLGAQLRLDANVLLASCKRGTDVPAVAQLQKTFTTLRPIVDALAEKGEDELAGNARFFNMLRVSSRELADTCFKPTRYSFINAMTLATGSLLWPEERVVNKAIYLNDAPATADGAMRAGIFDMPNAEHRFAKHKLYGSYKFRFNPELDLIKGNPKPKLDDMPPEYDGTIVVVYDEQGVHIYTRFKDPDARFVRQAQEGGARFELTLQHDDYAAYHQSFFNSMTQTDVEEVEWDVSQYGYKLTRKYVRNDAATTDNAYAFHTFYPWIMFYDMMPENGTMWRIVLCASWGVRDGDVNKTKYFRSVGGGSVHELGRGMQVFFDINATDRANIRRGLCRQAVSEFRKTRGRWENADFWSDPHIGDPEFHAKVVSPYLAKVDAADKAITDAGYTDEAVEELLKNHLYDFCDFGITADILRAKYLEENLFKE